MPVYNLRLCYSHTTNAGKSIITQLDREIKKPFAELYDTEGRLVRRELEKVVEGVLLEAAGGQKQPASVPVEAAKSK